MSVDAQPVQNADAARATRRERTAWFVLAILLLFSIAAPLNQFKVPPILPILMNAFQLSVGRAGLLMSVFAVTGLVLALPAGFIFQRMGYRITGLTAGGSIVIGAILGATSSGMGVMLTSRVIEGIGTSFMAVLAPAVIAVWFAAEKRGAAMGIWSAWVPIGSTAMLILAPTLSQGANWQAVWWFGCVYALLATALFLVFVKPASNDSLASGPQAAPPPMASAMQVLRNRDERPYMLGLALMAVVMPLIAVMGTGALIVPVIAQGLFGGLVPTNVFSAGVEVVKDERLGGLAMGVIMVGQNAGMLLGPIVFGVLVESAGGWQVAFGSLAIMCLLGALAGWLAKAR